LLPILDICRSDVHPVILVPERSEGARNPVINDVGYWIPGSLLRSAPE